MRTSLILIAGLLATACQAESNRDANFADNGVAAPVPAAPTPSPTPAGNDTAIPPAATPAPTPTPPLAEPAPTPDAEKSAQAAAGVLADYFAAVATRDYRRAYRMWSGGGQATGMTEAEFAASFAKYRDYDGNAGKPGETDGAAGSIYIEFPVQVTGVLKRGGGFVLQGPMTLKRVNDVDGSTAEQRRWHIASSGLKPRP